MPDLSFCSSALSVWPKRVAALVLAGFLFMPEAVQAQARWNPAAPENRGVFPTFNYSTVESVLTSIGATSERRGSADRPALAVTFSNKKRAAIIFGSCEQGGNACRAISIQAIWNRPANVPAERIASNIQQFSQRYAFSRAFLSRDGRPALQRYLTADYGFVRGNLAVNLLVFANQSERFEAEVLR